MAPTEAVHIRGIQSSLWREIRVEAVRRNVMTAEVVNEIVSDWLERRAASQSAPVNGRESTTAVTA